MIKMGKINHEYITGQYSPLGDFIEDQYVNNTRSTYLNVSGYLELSPIKDFTFTSRINGTLSDSRQGQYWGDQCNANRPSYAGSPHAAITNKNAWNYTWENILSYNTTIAKDHNIGGSVITSWNKNQNDSSLAAASGQMVDRWSFWRLASGASQHVESDFAQTRKCHLLFVSIILIKVSICLHSQIVGMVCLSSQQGISGIVSLLEQLHGVSLTNLYECGEKIG